MLAKFSAGRPLFPDYNFSVTVTSTYGTYRSGAVASLKFLAIENVPRITVHLRIIYYRQCAAGGFRVNPTG